MAAEAPTNKTDTNDDGSRMAMLVKLLKGFRYQEAEIKSAIQSVLGGGHKPDADTFTDAVVFAIRIKRQQQGIMNWDMADEKISDIMDITISPRVRAAIREFQWELDPKQKGKYMHFGGSLLRKGKPLARHTPPPLLPKDDRPQGYNVHGVGATFLASRGNVISPDDGFTQVIWEVTMLMPNKNPNKALQFRIGFVIAPILNFNALLAENWDHPKYGHLQAAVQVSGWGNQGKEVVQVYAEGKKYANVKSKDPKIKMNHSHGDRYALVFDFETKQVTLRYNDSEICVVHRNLKNAVLPAMSFHTAWGTQALAQCTKWIGVTKSSK